MQRWELIIIFTRPRDNYPPDRSSPALFHGLSWQRGAAKGERGGELRERVKDTKIRNREERLEWMLVIELVSSRASQPC